MKKRNLFIRILLAGVLAGSSVGGAYVYGPTAVSAEEASLDPAAAADSETSSLAESIAESGESGNEDSGKEEAHDSGSSDSGSGSSSENGSGSSSDKGSGSSSDTGSGSSSDAGSGKSSDSGSGSSSDSGSGKYSENGSASSGASSNSSSASDSGTSSSASGNSSSSNSGKSSSKSSKKGKSSDSNDADATAEDAADALADEIAKEAEEAADTAAQEISSDIQNDASEADDIAERSKKALEDEEAGLPSSSYGYAASNRSYYSGSYFVTDAQKRLALNIGFEQIDKVYAMSATGAEISIREGKGTDQRAVGTLPADGLMYVIEDDGGDWVFVESGEVRGYVQRADMKTGDEVNQTVSTTGEDKMSLADQLVDPLENEAYRSSLKTTKELNSLLNKLGEATVDRQAMISFSMQFLGNPYVWGGDSLTNGCDCSGFTQQIYAEFGMSLPRCSYEQAEVGVKIPKEEALPGDLLFYARDGVVYHVLMYIGDGKAINASSSSTGIIISNVNYDKVCWACRFIEETTDADGNEVKTTKEAISSGTQASDLQAVGQMAYSGDEAAQKQIIEALAKASVSEYSKYGFARSVIIAQAINETGWLSFPGNGAGILSTDNNVLGMNADLNNSTWTSPWTGRSATRLVPQYRNGGIDYGFEDMRLYEDIESCLEDYAAFKVGTHAELRGETDVDKVIGIGLKGYASDPSYQENIKKLVEKYNLTQYDVLPDDDGTESAASEAESVESGAESTNSEAESAESATENTGSSASEAEDAESAAESTASEAENSESAAESTVSEAESVDSADESAASGTESVDSADESGSAATETITESAASVAEAANVTEDVDSAAESAASATESSTESAASKNEITLKNAASDTEGSSDTTASGAEDAAESAASDAENGAESTDSKVESGVESSDSLTESATDSAASGTDAADDTEGAAKITYNNPTDTATYTTAGLNLIYAVVAETDDTDYEGALAVISTVMNRVDENFGNYGTTVFAQLTAEGQYVYSKSVDDTQHYKERMGGNVPDFVRQAVDDCLEKGIRNTTLNTVSKEKSEGAVQIGDCWYTDTVSEETPSADTATESSSSAGSAETTSVTGSAASDVASAPEKSSVQ